jgi:hypothetical protein
MNPSRYKPSKFLTLLLYALLELPLLLLDRCRCYTLGPSIYIALREKRTITVYSIIKPPLGVPVFGLLYN